MLKRQTTITIDEARIIWLALTVFQTRNLVGPDEPTVSKAMSHIESLFSEEEWSLYYERYHGKFLVGVDVLDARDSEPQPFDSAEEAIAEIKKKIVFFEKFPGVSETDIMFAMREADEFDAGGAAYGYDLRVPYRNGEIRFWLYPDVTRHNAYLKNETKGDKVTE